MEKFRVAVFANSKEMLKAMAQSFAKLPIDIQEFSDAEKFQAHLHAKRVHCIVFGPQASNELVFKTLKSRTSNKLNKETMIISMLDLPYDIKLIDIANKDPGFKIITTPCSLEILRRVVLSVYQGQANLMNHDIAQSFIHAAEEMSTHYFDAMQVELSRPSLTTKASGFARSYIYLSGGGAVGTMVISLTEDAICNALGKMMGCEYKSASEIEPGLISDFLVEFCNQVSGIAKGDLERLGIKIDLSIPRFMGPEIQHFVSPFPHRGGKVLLKNGNAKSKNIIQMMIGPKQEQSCIEFSLSKYA